MSTEIISVLILAGGRSRRMGQDKIWMALAGVPLVERVVERILPLAGELLLSAQAPARFEDLVGALRGRGMPARVVTDLYPGAGPLAGLHAGLNAARYGLVLALAGDMPFVNTALIEQMIALAEGFDAVVPEVPAGRQATCSRNRSTRCTARAVTRLWLRGSRRVIVRWSASCPTCARGSYPRMRSAVSTPISAPSSTPIRPRIGRRPNDCSPPRHCDTKKHREIGNLRVLGGSVPLW